MTTPTYTSQQKADFAKYEKVRTSGKHNMITPGAVRASGLSEERYTFVLMNYRALAQQIKEIVAAPAVPNIDYDPSSIS